MELDHSVLGGSCASCSTCGRTIGPHEARTRCGNCKVDCCLACTFDDEHLDHPRVRLSGFPHNEDDFESLIGKATEIAKQVGGRFHIEDNIYFSMVAEVLPHLRNDSTRGLLDALPNDVKVWIERNGEQFLRTYVSLWEMGRFVDYFDRLSPAKSSRETPNDSVRRSAAVASCCKA